MKFIIIGLGNFGAALSKNLTNLGHEVIGVDVDFNKVEALKNDIYSTICIDPKDTNALRSLPLKDADVVIVAIGEDFGASVMITAQLKHHFKVKRLVSRSISPLHKMVLEAIGVDEIISPEKESADRFAKKLELRGFIDSFELSDEYNIIEVRIPERYIGVSLKEINLRKDYNIILITIMRQEGRREDSEITRPRAMGVIPPETVFKKGDILVLYGMTSDVKRFLEG